VQLAFGSVLFGRLHPKADMSHCFNVGDPAGAVTRLGFNIRGWT
jgi:hypothetical protein